MVIDGGYRKKFTTELWLVPEGASPPTPTLTLAEPRVNTSVAYKFDEECFECAEPVNLTLYGLDEGLRFYAQALRDNPDSRALIIVRAGKYVGIRRALHEARKAKRLLVRNHGIEANRIIVMSGRRRNDNLAVAEMWIAPRSARFPTAAHNKSFDQSGDSVSFMLFCHSNLEWIRAARLIRALDLFHSLEM
jgi:hypothetical protein